MEKLIKIVSRQHFFSAVLIFAASCFLPENLHAGFLLIPDTLANQPSGKKSFSELEIYKAARDSVYSRYKPFKKYFSENKGIYLRNNVVHIFIDESGNLIETGIPTTAREDYTYQIHLFVQPSSKYQFEFSYEGKYEPSLNVYPLSEEKLPDLVVQAISQDKPQVFEIKFPIIGPFTNSFSLKLIRTGPGGTKTLIDRTVPVAKLYHVSLISGLLVTGLNNPTNISIFARPDGDTTLLADDPSTRGAVSLMAAFYPKPRSFLFGPDKCFTWERWAVIAGTRLDKDQFQNLFMGLQCDFARGGSVAFGLHYGQHVTIDGKRKFRFGVDKFQGALNDRIKKRWDVSWFLAINIDLRVVKYFIQNSAQ